MLSQAALQKKVDDWQKQMVELQSTFVEYNKELEKKQKELTDPIFERVVGAIKRIAGTDGYDLIVDRATVAFSRSDLDLTDRVIQIANGARRWLCGAGRLGEQGARARPRRPRLPPSRDLGRSRPAPGRDAGRARGASRRAGRRPAEARRPRASCPSRAATRVISRRSWHAASWRTHAAR